MTTEPVTPPPNYVALDVKVANLELGHAEMRKEIRSIDNKMDAGFALVAQKIDAKTTPQWQPIGILVSIFIAVGGAIIWPIRESISKHDAQFELIRRESEDRTRRLWEDANKTARELSYLQGQLHPLPPR